MRLYDVISQFDLDNLIGLLLSNYHKELSLNIDDSSNNYCNLSFNFGNGIDAGSEVIFNSGDELIVDCSDMRLSNMNYYLNLHYYQLNKGDYSQSKSYDELQTLTIELNDGENSIIFNNDQTYLQKDFTITLQGVAGYNLLLQSNKNIYGIGEDIILTAEYSYGGVPLKKKIVKFYRGSKVLGSSRTNDDGIAHFTVEDLDEGSYTFKAKATKAYSGRISAKVIKLDNYLEMTVTGSNFQTRNNSHPFNYNGTVFIDWGDNTGLIEYDGNAISYNFKDGMSTHTVKMYGDIYRLGTSCLSSCTGITSITIPDSVKSLGDACFYNCTGLTSLEIPDSVTEIGTGCFHSCSNLNSIVLPDNITVLKEELFRDCSNLTSITIPDSVTSIENHCFRKCTSLTSIELPNSLISLGNYCFANDILTSINIPASVSSIGDYCFYICSNLSSIEFNWDDASTILPYSKSWMRGTSNNLRIHIPAETYSKYVQKGYPSDKLVEDSSE